MRQRMKAAARRLRRPLLQQLELRTLLATFIVDRAGTIRFIERYDRGQLPDPDRMLAAVKKLG
jgi:alkyl hydroperoxide reductase subunit AhpC